jgi:hypothetical protein
MNPSFCQSHVPGITLTVFINSVYFSVYSNPFTGIVGFLNLCRHCPCNMYYPCTDVRDERWRVFSVRNDVFDRRQILEKEVKCLKGEIRVTLFIGKEMKINEG